MSVKQKYGIKYPFSSDNNEEIFLDVNDTYEDGIKSKLFHVLFTPKGQRIRMPEFGTDLIKYIFEPSDNTTINDLQASIQTDISKYVPEVKFKKIEINSDTDNGKIVTVHYSITRNGVTTDTSTAIRV